MKNYKHLNSRDEKKLMFYRCGKKNIKKLAKWTAVSLGIVFVFLVGMIAFYFVLDRDSGVSHKDTETHLAGFEQVNAADDIEGLSELDRMELERESEKEKIISDSQPTKANKPDNDFFDFSHWNKCCDPELIVINGGNKLPADFEVKTKICRGKEISTIAALDLEQMILDAKKDGILLWISSGYRSVDLQLRLFSRQVEREKSKGKEVISQEEAEKRAARVVARPHTSEHNTGLAVDFNGVEDDFYSTKEYKWLMDNAHKYGFIERYQKRWTKRTGVIYEPWHFRFVGKKYAPLIKESGKCLEEYVKNELISSILEGKV